MELEMLPCRIQVKVSVMSTYEEVTVYLLHYCAATLEQCSPDKLQHLNK